MAQIITPQLYIYIYIYSIVETTYQNQFGYISDICQCAPAVHLEAVPEGCPPPRYRPPYDYSRNSLNSFFCCLSLTSSSALCKYHLALSLLLWNQPLASAHSGISNYGVELIWEPARTPQPWKNQSSSKVTKTVTFGGLPQSDSKAASEVSFGPEVSRNPLILRTFVPHGPPLYGIFWGHLFCQIWGGAGWSELCSITSTGFYRRCTPDASAPAVVSMSLPRGPGWLGQLRERGPERSCFWGRGPSGQPRLQKTTFGVTLSHFGGPR